MKLGKPSIRVVTTVATLSLLVQPSAPIVLVIAAAGPPGQTATRPPATTAQSPPKTQTPPKTAAPAGAKPAAATTPAPIDGGWPRLADLPSGGTVLLYQPQVASWDKQAHLVAFSAVSHRGKAADKPAIGSIKLEA